MNTHKENRVVQLLVPDGGFMTGRILIILLLAVISRNTWLRKAAADEWSWPVPKDYRSDNGVYVAHIVPPEYLQDRVPFVQVKGPNNVQLWHTTLKNKQAPLEVYLADDGEHIITVNEHGSVGYGDYVLAFYNRNGLVKNYSMEQILHISANTSELELINLVPHSTTSRWWDENSIKFFVEHSGKRLFCIWLHLFDRWEAWEVTTGEEVKPDGSLLELCNRKARSWAVEQAQKGALGNSHYEFLGKMKEPEDKRYFESMLENESFDYCGCSSKSTLSPAKGIQRHHLERYIWCSRTRRLGKDILAKWDGKNRLGEVGGVINLPKTDEPNHAILVVYLIPQTLLPNSWKERIPVQRLIADLSDRQFADFDIDFARHFPFYIETVSPGKYKVKAVLDKPPFNCNASGRICLPQPGDYENTIMPDVEIKAGETVSNLVIDCDMRVTDGTD